MTHPPGFSRRARWAVPAAVAAIAGLVAGGTMLSAAQAAPALPARSAAQLLADVRHAAAGAPPPMTATIQESAALGLPDLPDMGNVSSALSVLSGSHTVAVWYADPAHVRLAEQVPMGETDLRRDGSQVWLWQSGSQTATHLVLPAHGPASGPHARLSGPATGIAGAALTPQQAARQVLSAVGPTTAVSVQQNVTVAGQSAYQLQIAPRDSSSLIGQIRVDIDATNYLPLQLQVLARGGASPAFQVGFTSLSFGRPTADNFAYAPPPGAKVKTVTMPARPGGLPRRVAPGSAPLMAAPGSAKIAHLRLRQAMASGKAARVRLRQVMAAGGGPAGSRPYVIGKDWLSVVVAPANAGLAALTGQGAGITGPASPSGSARPALAGGAGQGLAALRMLLRAATPVHGAWGSGRLLRTALVCVLLTSKGQALAGAVTPAVLFADAAQVK